MLPVCVGVFPPPPPHLHEHTEKECDDGHTKQDFWANKYHCRIMFLLLVLWAIVVPVLRRPVVMQDCSVGWVLYLTDMGTHGHLTF